MKLIFCLQAVSEVVSRLEQMMDQLDSPEAEKTEEQRLQMDILAGVIYGLQRPPDAPSYTNFLAPQSRDLVREKRTYHLWVLAAFAAGAQVAEPIRNWLKGN